MIRPFNRYHQPAPVNAEEAAIMSGFTFDQTWYVYRRIKATKNYLRYYMALTLRVPPHILWTFEMIRKSGIMSPYYAFFEPVYWE